MPSEISDNTLYSFLGFAPADDSTGTAVATSTGQTALDSLLGFNEPPQEKKKPKQYGSRELSDAERQQIIGTVDPTGFWGQTAANTSVGAIARGINRATMPEGVPYEEVPNAPLNPYEQAGSTVLSLIGDPLTHGAGRIGTAAGKAMFARPALELEKEALKYAIARGSVEGATTLGTMSAVHNPLEQYAATGEVDPAKYGEAVLQSTAMGGALGPVGKDVIGGASLPAEALTFAGTSAAMQGRLPTEEDYLQNAALILGVRGAGKLAELRDRLKTRGPNDDPVKISEEVIGKEKTDEVLQSLKPPTDTKPPAEPFTVAGSFAMTPEEAKKLGLDMVTPDQAKAILDDHAQRVEAGQKDPIPNRSTFGAISEQLGNASRKVRGAALEYLKQEQSNAASETKTNQEGESGRTGAENQAPGQAEEIPPVNDVLGGEQGPNWTWGEGGPTPSPREQARRDAANVPRETAQGSSPEERLTSLKNAATDAERMARDLPPIDPTDLSPSVSDQQMVDAGVQALARDPQAGYRLVESLKENPRSIDKASEEGILLVHRAELKRQHGDMLREMIAAQDAENLDRIAELTPIVRDLEAKRADVEEVGTLSGRLTGQSLQGRKAWIDPADYSLETMVMERRARKGRALTPDELSITKKLADAIEENNRKQQEINELKAAKAAAESLGNVETTVKRERISRAASARKEVDAVWADLELKFKGKLFSNPLDPELVGAGVRLAKAYIKLGVASVADFAAAIKAKIGEKKYEDNKDIWEEAWRIAIREIKPEPGRRNLAKPAGLSRFANELAKHFVETGVKDRDALIDAVHAELARAVPGITRRQTMDAISGYGQFKSLNKAELARELRDLKGQMQQVGKLEDMSAGTAPKKTGVERRTPSDEERRLIQQVNEAKKKGGYVVTDPEKQLKSSLNAIETRLKNEIADLETQIAKGERFVKEKTPPPTNDKIETLRAKVDALREQLDAIAPKPELTDAQRLQRYKATLERRNAELREQVATRNVKPKVRRAYELDNEAEKLRFEGERLREQRKKLLEHDEFMAKRPIKRALHHANDLMFNVPRTLEFGMDFGVAGVQGSAFSLAHPIKGIENLGKMFKALGDERAYSKIMHDIHSRPNFENGSYRRGKVPFSDPHGKLFAQEEAVRSSLIDKVPFLRAFPRATSAYLNLIRADYFDIMADSFAKDRRISDVEARAIGEATAIATGRGNFGKFNSSINLLNTLFLAPRYVMSRFQLLMGAPFWKGNVNTRLAVAKEYAKTMTGVAAVYGLASFALNWAYGPPGKDKEWNIDFTDPRSSDFGKIRIGDRRINPLFGLQQAIVFGTRELGSLLSVAMGKKPQTYGVKDPIYEFQRFLRTKAAPVPGMVYDFFKGKTFRGEKATPWLLMRNYVTPVNASEIVQDMIDNGIPEATAYGILNILGVSVQNYKKRPAA